MANCNKCGALNDATSEFCQNCGASLLTATRPPQAQPALQKGLLGKIERTIYFRVARGFSWLVLVFSLLGFVGAGFIAAIAASEYLKGEATVSKDDVMLAITVRKARRTAGTNADATQEIKLDPKAEGELTQVVAEIFNLLSKEDREKAGGKERFRSQMLEIASKVKVKGTGNANEQITEDGPWSRNSVSYPHILPVAHQNLNFLERYRSEMVAYLASEPSVKQHQDFHHLNSSQAMCLN